MMIHWLSFLLGALAPLILFLIMVGVAVIINFIRSLNKGDTK